MQKKGKMKTFFLILCVLQTSHATEVDFNQFENFVKNARMLNEEKDLIIKLRALKLTLQSVNENIQHRDLQKLQENLEKNSDTFKNLQNVQRQL